MISIENLCLGKEVADISDLNIDVGNGEIYVLLSSGNIVNNHLGNIFQGLEREFRGTVKVDSESITSPDWFQDSFMFVDSKKDWPPNIKANDLASFFQEQNKIPEEELEELFLRMKIGNSRRKRIHELEEVEWRKLVFCLARLKKCRNYIISDFAKGMPLDFVLDFKNIIYQMRNDDCAILYLSNDVFFAREIANRVGFIKKGKLLLELTGHRMRRLDMNDLYFKFLSEE